ncbi:hemolysin family protein [Rarobacter incanus]|uniref:Putative hemolysin n=1 Tax=Rarobacter incanus TaxID=153494 RepID=A0A542SQ25_9MICO|nr:hemolysin family protein [Rarobacter incanus]TQK76721.1 putative hemolysin [Rarobacter incanus]
MNPELWRSIVLVLVFIIVGGVFSGTETALVSLRASQLNQLARKGKRGQKAANLARDPNRFLAAVQIGVTVAGFLSAAYGASAISPFVTPLLVGWGMPQGAAASTTLIVLTLVIAYLSLVLGELVPKRFALQRQSTIALAVGPPLDKFARLMRPAIWVLSVSTDAVVRLLGGDPRAKSEDISDDELRDMVSQHKGFGKDERTILEDVLDSGTRTVSEVMRPRADVSFIKGTLTVAEAIEVVRALPYSRYPVTGETFDEIVGFLHIRDLLAAALNPADTHDTVAGLARAVLELPGTNPVLPTLSLMRRERRHMAIVVDEYGGTDGIVTLEDLVEELVGDIWDEFDSPTVIREAGPAANPLAGVDARVSIEDFTDRTGLPVPEGPYETIAGYVLAKLGALAKVGDSVPLGAYRIVVTKVEGRRIARLDVVEAGGTDAPRDS